jgi:hypothetical protein
MPRRLHGVALSDLLRLLILSLLCFAALNIGVDKAALNRPRTKERGLRNEIVEGLWCAFTIGLATAV